jgi:hypothetical protein
VLSAILCFCFLLFHTSSIVRTEEVFRPDESKGTTNPIRLEMTVSKNSYILGETVLVNIHVTNTSTESIFLPEHVSESFDILISDDGKEYDFYYGVGKGYQIDGVPEQIEIRSGATKEYSAKILWNAKPDVSHLNDDAAKDLLKGRILSDYAFPQKGCYFIKTVLKNPKTEIESPPVKVLIEEPQGENLGVWNIIKNNGEIGYFIQAGNFRIPSHKSDERAKLMQEIESLINTYPNSVYARSLSQSLAEYRSYEKEKNMFLIQTAPHKQL